MAKLLAVLPLAFVMVAGPQFISAVLLATSRDPRRSSLAYLAGVGLGTTIAVTVFYLLAGLIGGSSDDRAAGSGMSTLDYVVVVLLVAMAILTYLRRGKTKPPRWMTSLTEASPRFAFTLGLLLFLAMPTDLVTTMTVGSSLAAQDLPLWQCLPFVFMTMLLIGIPLILLMLMGDRAGRLLPRIREWMTANSWVVSEIVIVFFLIITLTG